MKGKKSRNILGKGCPCPKCGKHMQRREHNALWHPKASQPYYFAYWDYCQKCRHTQHYEKAKTWIKDLPPREHDELTLAFMDKMREEPVREEPKIDHNDTSVPWD